MRCMKCLFEFSIALMPNALEIGNAINQYGPQPPAPAHTDDKVPEDADAAAVEGAEDEAQMDPQPVAAPAMAAPAPVASTVAPRVSGTGMGLTRQGHQQAPRDALNPLGQALAQPAADALRAYHARATKASGAAEEATAKKQLFEAMAEKFASKSEAARPSPPYDQLYPISKDDAIAITSQQGFLSKLYKGSQLDKLCSKFEDNYISLLALSEFDTCKGAYDFLCGAGVPTGAAVLCTQLVNALKTHKHTFYGDDNLPL
jgi:hypothetical protein